MKVSHFCYYRITFLLLFLAFTCSSLSASTLSTPCYSLYDNQISISLNKIKNCNHKTKFVLIVHNSSDQNIYIPESSLYVLDNERTDYDIKYNNPIKSWTCIAPNTTKNLTVHVPNNNLKGDITIKGTITHHIPILFSYLESFHFTSSQEIFSLNFTN